MLYKLYQKGIGGKFYNLIENMYSNTKYCCKNDSHYSEPFVATRIRKLTQLNIAFIIIIQ